MADRSSEPVRPAPVHAAAVTLRPAGRNPVDGPERPLAARDGRPDRRPGRAGQPTARSPAATAPAAPSPAAPRRSPSQPPAAPAAAPASSPRAAAATAAPAAPCAGEALVLDVASGTAGVALQLASRTGARVVGLDLTEGMLRQGQANVTGAGLGSRIGLVAGQAERLPFPDASFDALTFTYLLRYVDDPQATLAELARVVKPGGTMASLEFCVPPAAFWRARVGAVHPGSSCQPGACCSVGGLAAGGPVPGAEHHRPLPPVSRPVDGRSVAAGRFHRGAGRGS